MKVTLTWYEVAMATHVGWMRQISVIQHNRTRNNGFHGGGWTEQLEGACGELAVAKALGVYWNGGVDTFKGADVHGLQVRTRSKHEYELIIRDNDKPTDRFVLVTGTAPHFEIRGWIDCADARRPEWRRNHGGFAPAYFVPHSELRPMESLAR